MPPATRTHGSAGRLGRLTRPRGDPRFERALSRGEKKGRYIPTPLIESIHGGVAANFVEWATNPGISYELLWNGVDEGEPLIPNRRGIEMTTTSKPKYDGKWHRDEDGYVLAVRDHHYSWKKGRASSIKISRGFSSRVREDGPGFPTAVHEFAHRVEYTTPGVRAAEWTFWTYRTRGEADKSLRSLTKQSGYGSGEVSRRDRWFDAYVGKNYGGGPMSTHEVLTMGLENLLTGAFGDFEEQDRDHRAWVIGMLASA